MCTNKIFDSCMNHFIGYKFEHHIALYDMGPAFLDCLSAAELASIKFCVVEKSSNNRNKFVVKIKTENTTLVSRDFHKYQAEMLMLNITDWLNGTL